MTGYGDHLEATEKLRVVRRLARKLRDGFRARGYSLRETIEHAADAVDEFWQ
jgi:hypothetical protein